MDPKHGKKKRNRLQPLEKQLLNESNVKAKTSQKGKKRLAEREGKSVVDARITQKILRQAREQLEEEVVPFLVLHVVGSGAVNVCVNVMAC